MYRGLGNRVQAGVGAHKAFRVYRVYRVYRVEGLWLRV